MKSKTQKFMENAQLSEKDLKSLNERNKMVQGVNDSNEKSVCSYCGNNMKLNSFQNPYGKSGFLTKNLFYVNSIKSTVKSELIK